MKRSRERGGVAGSILGILLCGGMGGFAAWSVVNALEIDGVTGAIAAAAIGMIIATALWTAGSWVLRTLGFLP